MNPQSVEAKTEEYLRRLPPGERKRLATLLGVGTRKDALTMRAVEKALSLPGTAKRLLEGLGEETLALLFRLVLRAGNEESLGWSGDLSSVLTRDSAAPLYERGIALPIYYIPHVLPMLAEVLRPSALRYAVDRNAGLEPSAPSYPFRLALTVAAYAYTEPTITSTGAMHQTSKRMMLKRLGEQGVFGIDPEYLGRRLARFGALFLREQGSRTTVDVDAATVRRVLSSDATDLAQAAVLCDGSPDDTIGILAVLRRAGGEPCGIEGILAGLRQQDERGENRRSLGNDPWRATQVLGAALMTGLIEGSRVGTETRFREGRPPPPGDARWIVQPSFDVLVPWDAAPARVALLGCVADVEHLDRVCRFRITQQSVLRGIRILGGGPRVTEILAEGAAAALPQNVAATVAGWCAVRPSLRPVKGEVLIAADPDLRAWLLRACPSAVEVAPGVFLPHERDVATLKRTAKKEGIPVDPVRLAAGAYGAPEDEREDPPDLARLAGDVRGRVNSLADAKPSKRTVTRPHRFVEDMPADPIPEDGLHSDLLSLLDELGEFDDEEEEDDAGVPIPSPLSVLQSSPTSWQAPLPGKLRSLLEQAAAAGSATQIVYVNSKHEPTEMTVYPRAVRDQGSRTYVDATQAEVGTACVLVLDRITSIRLSPPSATARE
jgi:hypothetical protein